MKKTVFLFLLVIFFYFCERENQVLEENTGIPLIEKEISDGEVYKIYTYSDANLPVEEKSKFHYTRHNYNTSNQLTSSDFYWDISMASSSWSVVQAALNRKEWVCPENTKKSLTKSYMYNNIGQSVKVIFDRTSANDNEYILYTLENGRIVRSASYWQSVMSFYTDYEYDDYDNLIRESKYYIPAEGNAELWTTTEYEFDRMNNPFRAFSRLMVPGKYTNRNNIVRETYTLHFKVDPWTDKIQITDYSYRYNKMGYPISVNGDTEYIYR